MFDNARYQRNAVVQSMAESLKITLLFLPSYSPNLNLIERRWKFIKRRTLYGRYHPTFADFRAAIEKTIAALDTTHADDLATLMTLNFQRFEDVSLMAEWIRSSDATHRTSFESPLRANLVERSQDWEWFSLSRGSVLVSRELRLAGMTCCWVTCSGVPCVVRSPA